MHADLHSWDRDTLGPKGRINISNKELEKLRIGPINAEPCSWQKEILVLIENLMDQEEFSWSHSGRADWLMHGDHTSSFFHNAAGAIKRQQY